MRRLYPAKQGDYSSALRVGWATGDIEAPEKVEGLTIGQKAWFAHMKLMRMGTCRLLSFCRGEGFPCLPRAVKTEPGINLRAHHSGQVLGSCGRTQRGMGGCELQVAQLSNG
jgi:hypothetical protein